MFSILVWQTLRNSQICPCSAHVDSYLRSHSAVSILSLAVSIYSSLHKEANSRTHLSKTLLSTYVRYLRRVVKSLWQDYNLVEELPGHPVVPSLLLSTFLFITPVHLKLLGSSKTLGAQLNSAKRQIDYYHTSGVSYNISFLNWLSYVLCRKCQFKMSGTQFHNPLFAL